MEEYKEILEVAMWILGGVGVVVSFLLSWIAFMIREDKVQNQTNYQMHEKRLKKHDKVFIKHDKKFDRQHMEIKSLIEVLKPNQIKKG